jgi:mannose-6-phosphate isomerase-like protein (cupin superfamily)
MKPEIRPFNPATEFHTDEQCYIIESSNTDNDPEVSIARARVLPGITTRWHKVIDTAERYVILSGIGVVEIGEMQPQQVAASDVVLIPPSCRQRISNTGSEDLIFLAICSPRFRQEAYRDVGDDKNRAL